MTDEQDIRKPSRFGVFVAPFHGDFAASPTLLLRRDLELVDHLDHLGYDEAGSASTTRRGGRRSARPRCSSPRPPSAPSASGWARAWRRCRTTTRSCRRPHLPARPPDDGPGDARRRARASCRPTPT